VKYFIICVNDREEELYVCVLLVSVIKKQLKTNFGDLNKVAIMLKIIACE
jgi:hypothetical protein